MAASGAAAAASVLVWFAVLAGVAAPVSAEAPPFADFFSRSEREVLSRMSLEEKIGQLLIFGFQGKEFDGDFKGWLSSGRLGNVKIFLRNVEGRAQLKALTQRVNELSSGAGQGIPPFIATDMEGGTVNHVRYTGIRLAPPAGLLGATRNAENGRVASRLIALTLLDAGINMNFAPCADVLTEPGNKVIMTRSYGSDPGLVSEMVEAFVEEHERFGVLPVVKHFPGHGMTAFDSHSVTGRVGTPRSELKKVHLRPYENLIDGRLLRGCMTAHIVYEEIDPDNPATFSFTVIEELLRRDLGFKGVVVTDELEMGGAENASKGIVESFARAFEAGNDLFLVGHTKEKEAKLIKELPGLFETGRLSAKELDKKVLRVLAEKKRSLKIFFESGGRASKEPAAKGPAAERPAKDLYDETVAANRAAAKEGICLLASKVKGGIPRYLEDAARRKRKGLVLAPTNGFGGLAKRYRPGWDVIDIGYAPERDRGKEAEGAKGARGADAALAKKLKPYGIVLLGFSSEAHAEWAEACIKAKVPFFVLSIENPFPAMAFSREALFIAAAFGPNSPATDALFESVFVTGEFRGRFPYVGAKP